MQFFAKNAGIVKGVFFVNETTKKPKGFVCYLNNHVMLKHLTDSEAGQLWKLLYRFAETGEAGESDSGEHAV